ncbi:hypothetical protein [Ensifer sp. SL37]|uniref:hypothetical protein n=1 Tax=Ensifer sp. SL37 TaxID=2995137 RepID=UPI002275E34B|nr:hypothetical protein [Ensifer sp. SL37]MCY1741429.1 hypothetical protein [Ensifer sp. SL37]
MRVQYEIANGHKRGEDGLLEFIKRNPGMTKDTAISSWIDNKFGTFIRDSISDDFIIPLTSESGFVVDFTYESDADDFIKRAGGHKLEE